MKIKKNTYAEYIKANNYYYCYSYQLGTLVVINEQNIIDGIDLLLNDKYIDVDSTNSIWAKLIENNIVLNADVDEALMAEYTYQNFFVKKSTLQITAIVTRNCNFACPYCPQEHVSKKMSQEVFENLLKLVEHIAQEKKYSQFVISWFGGEPMLMYEDIVDFCVKANVIAHNNKLKIVYGMTTNGYLLNKEKASVLFELGVLHYQITLDGTAVSHDKLRKLKNNGCTWNTIWENLCSFSETKYEFDIGIRINCAPEIIAESFELIDMISENLDSRYSIIPYSRNDMGGESDSKIRYCSKFESEVIKYELFNYAMDKNVKSTHSFKYMKPFSRICTSNDPNFFVLDYDGTLKKCEAVLDFPKNVVGYLSANGEMIINHEINAAWTVKKQKESCFSCKKYPLCYGFDCREKILNRNIIDEECVDDFGLELEYIKKYCEKFLEKVDK